MQTGEVHVWSKSPVSGIHGAGMRAEHCIVKRELYTSNQSMHNGVYMKVGMPHILCNQNKEDEHMQTNP